MEKKRIVIALGHDALGTTLPEQQKALVKTAKAVAEFIKQDYQVVITHSNGPQVSMIHTAMSEFCRLYPEYTATPMSVCSVIACGGGGIPVLQQDNHLKGASAVIEKDTIAGQLADQLDADMLVILTGVDKVCLGFGTDHEKPLDYMSIQDAKNYMAAGEFEEGTMLPKIQAAVDYIGDSAIRKVLITKLSAEDAAIGGENGTMIGK